MLIPKPEDRYPLAFLAPRRWACSVADVWQVARVLRNPLRQWRLNAILAHASIHPFVIQDYRLRLKYLVAYASRSMSTAQRWSILCGHYEFLQERFSESFFTHVFTAHISLWTRVTRQGAISIVLDFPASMQTEGDLRMTVVVGGKPVYRLIFVVGPAGAVEQSAKHALFITCIQGLADSALLRLTANECEQMHPSDLLMSALAGFAQTCGIDTVFGIKTIDQVANSGRIYFSYDEFFEQYGKLSQGRNLYRIEIPFPHKAINTIAAHHRSRTRRKRELGESVSAAAREKMRRFRTDKPQDAA